MKAMNKTLVVFGLILACVARAETSGPTLKLTGKVVDTDGRPVTGAVVEKLLYKDAQDPGDTVLRSETDAAGKYELQVANKKWTALGARKAGYAVAWKQFLPSSNEVPDLVLSAPSFVAGVVTDENNKVVADAAVEITGIFVRSGQGYNSLMGRRARTCFNARTDASGRFKIEAVPADAALEVVARFPGKAMRLQTERRYASADNMQFHSGQDDVQLTLEPAGAVDGKIVMEEPGQPIPAAEASLDMDGFDWAGIAPLKVGEDGAFRFKDVPAGSYKVRVTFGTNAFSDWVAAPVAVSVESGKPTSGITVQVNRGGVLEAMFFAKTDRKAVADVNVSAYHENQNANATSNDKGIARLRLTPGNYQVSVSKNGFISENNSTEIEAGKTNRIQVELAPAPKITGIARDPDGKPAAGLPLRLVGMFGQDADCKTGADGRFEMEWNPRRYGNNDGTACVWIRDAVHNLTAAQDIEEDTAPVELKLAPGLTIVGRAEYNGKPVTNATATLIFWRGNSGMHISGLAAGTNTPGNFEISALPAGRKYGLYVSGPGFGQKQVQVPEESEAKRIELGAIELKPANLKLAGQVVDADEKPVRGAHVNLYGEGQPNGNTQTDREGRFTFNQVCEGSVRLSASANNSHGSVSAQGGDTNVVLKLGQTYSSSSSSGSSGSKLKGIVTDPDGKPVAGAQIRVFPNSERTAKTGTNGTYSTSWHLDSWQADSGGNPMLMIRDTAHDLAALEYIPEKGTNLDVQLAPAATITGRVETPEGTPLANADVGIWFLACRTYNNVIEPAVKTDSDGKFELKTLPTGTEYRVFATTKDRGKVQQSVEIATDTNRVELKPFVLKLADKMIAGQVIDGKEKPVSGVYVGAHGEGQPDCNMQTDSKGRFTFKVCDGEMQIYASGQNGYANTTVTAGDTNIVLQLSNGGSGEMPAPQRVSLKGKPLPDLTSLGIANDAILAEKPLLICLFDAEQRPSRRCARLIAEQHDALKQKGVSVVAIQAAIGSAETLQSWKDSNSVPFPVGRVAERNDASKWATDVQSLPWLILRDTKGNVAAEGFTLDELDAKLNALK